MSFLYLTRRWPAALGVVGLLIALSSARALELLTPQEAALPDASLASATKPSTRALTRAPTVSLVSPPPDAGAVQSPLEFKLVFQSHGGSQIDPNTVKITYLKQPLIDLTGRVNAFVNATGIDLSNVEIPPGIHHIRVEVMDTDGRLAVSTFSFTVGPH